MVLCSKNTLNSIFLKEFNMKKLLEKHTLWEIVRNAIAGLIILWAVIFGALVLTFAVI